MEHAGGLSVRDKLYLLTNAFDDEKSGGANPGRDNMELADIDFISGWAAGAVLSGLVGAGPGWDGDAGVLDSERGEAAGTVGPDWGGEVDTTGRDWGGGVDAGPGK